MKLENSKNQCLQRQKLNQVKTSLKSGKQAMKMWFGAVRGAWVCCNIEFRCELGYKTLEIQHWFLSFWLGLLKSTCMYCKRCFVMSLLLALQGSIVTLPHGFHSVVENALLLRLKAVGSLGWSMCAIVTSHCESSVCNRLSPLVERANQSTKDR